ncbi:MAG: hypothetical protein FJ096_09960 [Deltaproteobacteria bacterium]|nr:hypothetical protein [Deltaproteobacteria bacterium]
MPRETAAGANVGVSSQNAEPAGTGDDSDGTSRKPKKRKERPGGVNPCMTPDPGFGAYDGWSRKISMGQFIAPKRGGLTKAGSFDVLIHFHGHEPARKEFVKTANGIVLVGIDLGIGSGAYSSSFASPNVFEHLLDSIEKEMARRAGIPRARIRHLGLSSWSAGYGAIQQILLQPAGAKVDSIVLLDSLHAGYLGDGPEVAPAGLAQFIEFARKSASGKRFMFQSYSSIIPPGYASTREVAHYLIDALNGQSRVSRRADVLGLAMDERFDRGNYHVRGYLGDDKPDHCAHLGLLKDIVKTHLNRRWNPPRAVAERGSKATKVGGQTPKTAKKTAKGKKAKKATSAPRAAPR